MINLFAWQTALPRVCLLLGLLVPTFSCAQESNKQELPEKITVATWNVEWFFDHVTSDNGKGLPQKLSAPSQEEWEWKLQKVTEVVAEMKPTILALQEVEDREVVWQLCKKLKEQGLAYRYAFVGGYEFATEQDVAIIYQSGCVEYSRKEQTDEMHASKTFYNLGKHLFARFQWGSGENAQELLICNVHLRAAPEREDVRKRQSRLVRHWVQEAITNGENVIVIGDINTEHGAGVEVHGSDMEILKGSITENSGDDLHDLNEHLAEDSRDTHLIGKEFDRILVSGALVEDAAGESDLSFSTIVNRKDLVVVGKQDEDHFNIFYDIPQDERDISDHYPVMAEFLIK